MLSIERPSKNGMMRPMSRLRYWHPVLTANELPRDSPCRCPSRRAGHRPVPHVGRRAGRARGAYSDRALEGWRGVSGAGPEKFDALSLMRKLRLS